MAKKETVTKTATKAAAPAKKAPAAKASAKSVGAKAAKPAGKVNPALMKPLMPSKELGAVVGTDPIPRPQVVKKLWDYIKANNLQNPANKREIKADDKLKKVFGKDSVTMFEMNKYVAAHLK